MLAGARALDTAERELLADSNIVLLPPDQLAGDDSALVATLDELARRIDSVDVHVDLDVIDVSDGIGNEFAAAGGPSVDVLAISIAGVAARCLINSVSLTSYNPAVDRDGRVLLAGQRILHVLGSAVATPQG